jgi:hypothetical protein
MMAGCIRFVHLVCILAADTGSVAFDGSTLWSRLMSSHKRLTDLLIRWQEELEQGRDISAMELCQGDPALLPELERRLADLRRLTGLAVQLGQGDPAIVDLAIGGVGAAPK